MNAPDYAMAVELPDVFYADAIEKTTEALKTEGFGVLTEIDVQATMKKKLDVDMEPYVILGACNPPLAHRALSGDDHIGLLLPCNVVVMGRGEGSVVSIIQPKKMFQVVDNPGVAPIADEVEEKLRRVLGVLSSEKE